MCYDIYGRISGTCGCDRPAPKVIDHGTSKLYIYPFWKYDPVTGKGYWAYPDTTPWANGDGEIVIDSEYYIDDYFEFDLDEVSNG